MPTIPITLSGHLGSDPDCKLLDTGRPRANFRMAVNRSTLDRSTGEYTNHDPSWFQVECYGNLASNVSFSLFKGMSVVVHGHLIVEDWESGGRTGRTAKVVAQNVGADLRYGTSVYSKAGATRRQTNEGGDEAVTDPWGQTASGHGGSAMDFEPENGLPDEPSIPSEPYGTSGGDRAEADDADENGGTVDEVARATAEATAPF